MLTRKQKELFDFLNEYINENQISPTFEEMKNAVNLKSKSGIHRLITSLEQRGFIKRLKHRARAMEITKTIHKAQKDIKNSIEIPLLGSIAAGNPIEAIENPEEFIKTNSVLNGKIAAVLTNENEITLKTIEVKGNKIYLIPANKSFTKKEFNINEVQIQGALSGIIRKYN